MLGIEDGRQGNDSAFMAKAAASHDQIIENKQRRGLRPMEAGRIHAGNVLLCTECVVYVLRTIRTMAS